jgi:outer membrane protein OmpA-like peptidoglycan-associated protein
MKNITIVVLVLVIVISGCKTTRTQRGAMIGAGAGAAVGAIIGKTAGNTGVGAVVGATVGGVAGAIIGKKMDKQAQEIKNEIPNAEVIHEEGSDGIIVNFESKVLFGFDKSDLSEASKSTINDLAVILNKYPDTDLTIQGHTDSKGSETYNQTLSEKRAKAVADFLKSQGVVTSRITPVGFGESQPVASNNTEEGRAENRRVTFLIIPNEKMKQDAIKEAGQQ